jgi:hypothetical protein
MHMLSAWGVVFIQQFQGVGWLTHECRRGSQWLSQAAETILPKRRETGAESSNDLAKQPDISAG